MHPRVVRQLVLMAGLIAGISACSAASDKSPSPSDSQSSQHGQPKLEDPYNVNSALTMGGIAADTRSVYVAIGGWNSCVDDPRIPGQPNPWGMNMNKGFSKLMKHVESRTGQPPHFVIACHSPDTTVARYVISSAPGTMRVQPHPNLFQDIAQFAGSLNAPVVLLGHSYGGSFVMRAALELPQQVSIAQLITIDGISPVNCPPAVMAKLLVDRFGQITGLGGSNSDGGIGCQQSPREFSPDQKRTIRSRVGWWQNYHQSDLLSILKADAIPEACNTPVKHDDLKSLINGHIAMGMYNKLWQDISSRLTTRAPAGCLMQPI